MSKQNISNASQLYTGKGSYPPLFGKNKRNGVPLMAITKVDMGTPDADDPDGFVISQSLTALGVFSTDTDVAGALAAAALTGIADVPRNVVAAWTGTAIITITGLDEYGQVMSEASPSGTTFTGAKAFKAITDITVSADVTLLTVGTGEVFGLPYVLTTKSDILAFYTNLVEEGNTSTFVAGDSTPATTTTGDVRGTVTPNTPANNLATVLWMHVQDNGSKEGLVGVTQA